MYAGTDQRRLLLFGGTGCSLVPVYGVGGRGEGLGRLLRGFSSVSVAFRLLLAGVTGWMLMIRGASLAGTEPAETRCLNSLMSRGVGLGGSCCSGGNVGVVGKLLVDAGAVCGVDGARSLLASDSL